MRPNRFFEYMKRLPQFMWDNRFETTASGYLSGSDRPDKQVRIEAEVQDALLVTAKNPTTGGYALILDIDFPVEVVKSSSGNSHLYFDVWLTREQHNSVIAALRDAGIVQETWANSAIENEGGSHLRPPWVEKGYDQTMSQQEAPTPVPVPAGTRKPVSFVSKEHLTTTEDVTF